MKKVLLLSCAVSLITAISSCSKSSNNPPPNPSAGYTNIYNAGTASLKTARSGMAAGTANALVLFAGGTTDNGTTFSTTVDIFNVATASLTSGNLSEARYMLAGAGAAGKVVFAGGYGSGTFSKTVDIYDINKGGWTT